MVTVLKPTQVGVMNNLRRARQLSLRNSANYSRNFGRREATFCDSLRVMSKRWPQRNGPGDCLPKTQHFAKPCKAMYKV